jgi:hypothetical protein
MAGLTDMVGLGEGLVGINIEAITDVATEADGAADGAAAGRLGPSGNKTEYQLKRMITARLS